MTETGASPAKKKRITQFWRAPTAAMTRTGRQNVAPNNEKPRGQNTLKTMGRRGRRLTPLTPLTPLLQLIQQFRGGSSPFRGQGRAEM